MTIFGVFGRTATLAAGGTVAALVAALLLVAPGDDPGSPAEDRDPDD
jgi:hypothetical protein